MQEILEQLRKLQLPSNQYAIFGSGPLMAHNLRQSRDIDLIVTDALYQQLKEQGWVEHHWADGAIFLAYQNFEATTTWNYSTYRPNIASLIAEADVIEGLSFVRLTEVLAWKKAFNRPKDQSDIKLIEEYLSTQSNLKGTQQGEPL